MEINRKRCKVVILPTDKAENCIIQHYGNLHYYSKEFFTQEFLRSVNGTSHHLYFTTQDEEIKEGDWYLNGKYLYQANKNYDKASSDRKIIATTAPKLTVNEIGVDSWKERKDILYPNKLPQPSQAFIEKYCKLGGIDEVDVEYISKEGQYTSPETDWYYNQLKVDSHNTITIHGIKNSWTREEIENLCRLAYIAGGDLKEAQINDPINVVDTVDNWIKENL